MAMRPLPPAEYLRQRLSYEEDTGLLFWKPVSPQVFAAGYPPNPRCNNWNGHYAGTEAFTATNPKGYRIGRLGEKNFFAHRIIWKIVTGDDPSGVIDHINGITSDNRWVNLRDVSHTLNRANGQKVRAASGYRGVYVVTTSGRWSAKIKAGDKNLHLGVFDTKEEAALAYDNAAIDLYGAHASPNFKHQSPAREPSSCHPTKSGMPVRSA